ncbi:MAG: KaiC/GvpD/RAD55 family RecA-like ATPase [Candidatus Woesearchaeota archaeon]|jgi:KaiC/GvpD/RAD55 family RecA-like ATPase
MTTQSSHQHIETFTQSRISSGDSLDSIKQKLRLFGSETTPIASDEWYELLRMVDYISREEHHHIPLPLIRRALLDSGWGKKLVTAAIVISQSHLPRPKEIIEGDKELSDIDKLNKEVKEKVKKTQHIAEQLEHDRERIAHQFVKSKFIRKHHFYTDTVETTYKKEIADQKQEIQDQINSLKQNALRQKAQITQVQLKTSDPKKGGNSSGGASSQGKIELDNGTGAEDDHSVHIHADALKFDGAADPTLQAKMDLLEQKMLNMSSSTGGPAPKGAVYGQGAMVNKFAPEELKFADKARGDRAQTGLGDLDKIIDGGFPRGATTLVSGGAGTGKTTLALQFIVNGIIVNNEPGVYITFEQTRDAILQLGVQFGWDLPKLEEEGKLVIREYTPEQISKALRSGGGSFRDLLDSISAKRLAIDSITEYIAMFEGEKSQRKKLTELFKTFKKWNITTVVIGEEESSPHMHTSSVLDYESDGVVLLYNERKGDFRQRSFEIFKMRGTMHAGRIFPMTISDAEGVTIHIRDVDLVDEI